MNAATCNFRVELSGRGEGRGGEGNGALSGASREMGISAHYVPLDC